VIGNATIKVSTEVLVAKANEVTQRINSMSNCFDDLETLIARTSYYWIGEAGDMHRKLYQEQKEDVTEMMKRLREHPRDLIAIAQNYSETEKSVTEVANMLSGDVIQ